MENITSKNPYATTYDLDNCDKEPIHIIQTVQRFACLLAISGDGEGRVEQVSKNVNEFLAVSHEEILSKSIFDFIPSDAAQRIKQGIATGDFSVLNPVVLPFESKDFKERLLTIHQTDDQFYVEIEHRIEQENDLYFLSMVDQAIQRIQASTMENNLLQKTVEEVKKITNYDRVMIYQFDKHFNGQVVAEAKEEKLEAFLGLCYPASDIPKQARDLFFTNKVRILTNIEEAFSFVYPPLHPKKNTPLNIAKSAARGTSPIHLEYLRNMGVSASLTVAIIENNKLWGLIACHHGQKKVLDYRMRSLIKFMGTIISGHLALQRATEFRKNILQNNIIHAQLFEHMSKEQDIVRGLTEGTYSLLDYIPADGAVIILEGNIVSIGHTPTNSQINQLLDWFGKHLSVNLFSTDCLTKENPDFSNFTNNFSGVLSVNISSNASEYIIWFRQAQEREVIWGGNPKATKVRSSETGRLTPRKSFEKWKEVVSNQSLPWSEQNKNAALKLRDDIKDILLKRFSQLKELHDDLNRSYLELENFSYTVSHDLRSPLRGIEGFAQILVEDYADKLDDFGLEVINTIVNSADKMNSFINDILKLSKLAKKEMVLQEIDVKSLLEDIIKDYKVIARKRKTVKIILEDCPPIKGDPITIRQLFANLIDNAVKYSRPIDDSFVIIGGKEIGRKVSYYVKDNGIGFEVAYAAKIYEVFSRLVSDDEYEGTGIGLSIVKRVVDRHKAKISVESVPNEGTTFYIDFQK